MMLDWKFEVGTKYNGAATPQKIKLNGAGATFPAPLPWFPSRNCLVGSDGVRQFTAKTPWCQ